MERTKRAVWRIVLPGNYSNQLPPPTMTGGSSPARILVCTFIVNLLSREV